MKAIDYLPRLETKLWVRSTCHQSVQQTDRKGVTMPTETVTGSTPANGAASNYNTPRDFKANSSIKLTSLTRPSAGHIGCNGGPSERLRVGLLNGSGSRVAVVEIPKADMNKTFSFCNAKGRYELAARYAGGGLHGGLPANWAATLYH